MEYTSEQFVRLMSEIESQGGRHLDETHDNVYHTPLAGPDLAGYEVVNCGRNYLFELPYEHISEGGTLRTAKVCAIDDSIGAWPRFASANAKGRES